MMTNYTTAFALFAAMLLGACSAGDEQASAAEPPPAEDTVFGDMVGTMDKARGVQDTVDARKRELDREMRVQEGEEAP